MFGILAAAPAPAQEAALQPPALPSSAPARDGPDGALPDLALNPDDSALIGKALVFDPDQFAGRRPVTPLRRADPANGKPFDVARTDRPDGTSTVIVKKSLATGWDTKVGADLGLAADPADHNRFGNSIQGLRNDSGSGVAWASLDLPQFASVDARVDPGNDSSRFGTTLRHAMPVSGQFTVTLQSRASLTETYGQAQAAPSGLPLTALPVAKPEDPVPQVWGHENLAKLDILPTGTTLAAGLSSTSTDPVTHNTLSADQKLYGPLHVTTAVNDIGQSGESRSIRARFKLTW